MSTPHSSGRTEAVTSSGRGWRRAAARPPGRRAGRTRPRARRRTSGRRRGGDGPPEVSGSVGAARDGAPQQGVAEQCVRDEPADPRARGRRPAGADAQWPAPQGAPQCQGHGERAAEQHGEPRGPCAPPRSAAGRRRAGRAGQQGEQGPATRGTSGPWLASFAALEALDRRRRGARARTSPRPGRTRPGGGSARRPGRSVRASLQAGRDLQRVDGTGAQSRCWALSAFTGSAAPHHGGVAGRPAVAAGRALASGADARPSSSASRATSAADARSFVAAGAGASSPKAGPTADASTAAPGAVRPAQAPPPRAVAPTAGPSRSPLPGLWARRPCRPYLPGASYGRRSLPLLALVVLLRQPSQGHPAPAADAEPAGTAQRPGTCASAGWAKGTGPPPPRVQGIAAHRAVRDNLQGGNAAKCRDVPRR
ncbi:hypothetical protein SALBM135S_04995 [Streptomyces alboniger]